MTSGRRRLIWITPIDTRNYLKKRPNIVYFRLSEETSRDTTGSRKVFTGCQIEHIDTVLEFKTPLWLDEIICFTNGNVEDHEREVREVLTKLQKAGYRASEKKLNYSNGN